MTDPRIEAAAKAFGEYVYERNGKPLKWEDMGENRQEVARCYARVALAAADAAAWRPIATAPVDKLIIIGHSKYSIPGEKSSVSAIPAWDGLYFALMFPEEPISPQPTHWQPRPDPPKAQNT